MNLMPNDLAHLFLPVYHLHQVILRNDVQKDVDVCHTHVAINQDN